MLTNFGIIYSNSFNIFEVRHKNYGKVCYKQAQAFQPIKINNFYYLNNKMNILNYKKFFTVEVTLIHIFLKEIA